MDGDDDMTNKRALYKVAYRLEGDEISPGTSFYSLPEQGNYEVFTPVHGNTEDILNVAATAAAVATTEANAKSVEEDRISYTEDILKDKLKKKQSETEDIEFLQ